MPVKYNISAMDFTNSAQEAPRFSHGEEPPKGARWAYLIWGLGTGVPFAYSSFRFSIAQVE